MIRALFVVVNLTLFGLVACAGLSPAEQADIAGAAAADQAVILRCEAEGRACKADGGTNCFGVYDACMRDGGLR